MTPDNPEKHRRSIRLREYDYTQPGAYFITVCAYRKQSLFGTITDGVVTLSRCGEIVRQCWLNLPRCFPSIELDAFVVMPNHMHGTIMVTDGPVAYCEQGEAFPTRTDNKAQTRTGNASPLHTPHGTDPGSICAIVQNFKSVSTRKVNRANRTPGVPLWQRNYYEHVIRNDHSLHEIRDYIEGNPCAWLRDEYNADTTWL